MQLIYTFSFKKNLSKSAKLAAQKDTGFDLYWFAVSNRAQSFPDEIERWPVKMFLPCDPIHLKREFKILADDLMYKLTG